MKCILLLACCCLTGVVHSKGTFTPNAISISARRLQFKPDAARSELSPLKSHIISLRGGESGTSSRKKKKKRKGGDSKSTTSTSTTFTTVIDTCSATYDDDDDQSHRSSSMNTLKNHHTSNDKHQCNENDADADLPTIKAILVPRRISMPQIIRLISAFLFTSSLLESLRTSGTPYTEAVKSILQAHGVNTLIHGGGDSIISKINPLDEYFAKKICQGENNLLPPKYFPSTLPLVGLMLSIFFHVGFTTLFPKWFVEFNVWLNYERVDVDNIHGVDSSSPDSLQHSEKKLHAIESFLKEDVDGNGISGENDDYYQSQFINRNNAPLGKNPYSKPTGLAVLIQLSKQQREMASDGKSVDVQWLYRSESTSGDRDHPQPYFIEVGQRRVYVNLNLNSSDGNGSISTACQDGGPSFYHENDISQLMERGSSGLSNQEDLDYAAIRYGTYNDLSVPIPTVHDAFVSRLSSPLAVLQLVGRVLTALEETFFPALMNIIMTLGQHYMNAKKSIVSAKELSSEIQGNADHVREQLFWTLRPSRSRASNSTRKKGKKAKAKWLEIPSSQLLPGDVFYLPSRDTMMPVDALILEGNCIAQEAVITGESVPQAKTAVEPDDSLEDGSDMLSMDLKHRNSVLFAGTTVIHCDNESEEFRSGDLPQSVRESSSPMKCLALKSGSYSSKGEIIRALSKSSGHAGSISTLQSEKDSLRLIIALSSFAVVACASLFIPTDSGTSRKTSGFRRIIQCTRIAVASIPSDLPLALNSIVHSCAQVIRKEADVVCSEPGSLLSASQIDMVVFDKTGTLSADTQTMTDIVNLPDSSTAHNRLAEVVLAGCHSLSSMKGTSSKPIGDPLDVASLEYSSWTFNSTAKMAYVAAQSPNSMHSNVQADEEIIPNARKLWQRKTFPFDPTKRRSSALLLVQHENNEYRLWKVVKGAPDSMTSLFCTNKETFLGAYDDMVEDLGSKGTRIVALAVQDVTHSTITETLFPRGLPESKSLSSKKLDTNVLKYVAKARKTATHDLHVGDFEKSLKESMTFVGFACFDASIRPSTPRIINDIRGSGTDVCMLTGDGTAAALSVARQANFFDEKRCKKVAILQVKNNQLIWTLTRLKNGRTDEREFDIETTTELIGNQQRCACAIMITGNAMESILEPAKNDDAAAKMMLNNLDKVAVISRSSPQIKQQVLSVLKSLCGRNVMMCGDGVNDISAMKTADISAALLNGFGREEINAESDVDTENERRKAKLKYKKIGRDRNAADFGTEGHNRIKRKLEEAIAHDKNNPQSGIDAILNVLKEEYMRAKELRKGGATAARILQEEDSLRKSMMTKSLISSDAVEYSEDLNSQEDGIETIKPGESSLAAQFTFLRPCIDGADAIVRTGVAAAAFSLSSHREIALNSLMACHNLASLYRDGFRYGKYMWNVELTFIMAMEQGQSDISSTPRSRIPRIRPHESIFHPAVALSILLQSIIHLFVLSKGVKGANQMESYHNQHTDGLRIRFSHSMLQGMNMPITEGGSGGNVLGRMPFRPNLVTNVVFLLSIVQNVMISSVNHSGLLFHGSLLESRSFCIWASLSIIFCIAMVLEVQPSINEMLQLAPMSSKAVQIFVISLILFDGIAAFLADRLCIYFLDRQQWVELQEVKNREPVEGSEYAADIEDNLLRTVRQKNFTFVRRMAMISFIFVMQTLKS